jgi:HAD superfamily hydrolase (TIGR01459 family)
LHLLAGKFDGLLLDQWGVLHDGQRPYPGAVECLSRLRSAGMRVIILSNSGKSGADNARLIEAMGFPGSLFDAVVSAGDDARDALLYPQDGFYLGLGRRCLLLSRDSDRHVAGGLGLDVLTDPDGGVEEADFLLLMSMDAPNQSVAGWEPVLQRAAARDLPMICANPDLARVTPEGTLLEAPGLVAQRYAALGGRVSLHGKPDARIYRNCLKRLGCEKDRVLAIGDSLHHDILGARSAGLANLLIAGGVHRDELGCRFGELPDPAQAGELFARTGVRPDLLAASFAW